MLNSAFRPARCAPPGGGCCRPSVALALFVVAIFMITRAYEEVLNPRLRLE